MEVLNQATFECRRVGVPSNTPCGLWRNKSVEVNPEFTLPFKYFVQYAYARGVQSHSFPMQGTRDTANKKRKFYGETDIRVKLGNRLSHQAHAWLVLLSIDRPILALPYEPLWRPVTFGVVVCQGAYLTLYYCQDYGA